MGARGPQSQFVADFDRKLTLWRRLASSFTYGSLPDCRQTMARAEGLNHCNGYFFARDHRFGARGAERSKCDIEKFSKSDFVRIRQIWRRLARSVINRSSTVHHRTIPRAECVNVRTGEFSQGHNFWRLGPPKSTFCRFLPRFAACSELIYQPIATAVPPYDSAGLGRQCTRRTLFGRGTVWGVGAPKTTFLPILHFRGL